MGLAASKDTAHCMQTEKRRWLLGREGREQVHLELTGSTSQLGLVTKDNVVNLA